VSLIPAGTTVTVESKYFPPLTVDLGGQDEAPPGFVIRTLKPKVTLRLNGHVLTSVAPGGEPAPNQWPKMKIGLIVAGALVFFSLLRIIK
jgi:hypothetical protein